MDEKKKLAYKLGVTVLIILAVLTAIEFALASIHRYPESLVCRSKLHALAAIIQ